MAHSPVPHLPVLRAGRPYESLTQVELKDVRDGSPVARVSHANAGLIARDLAQAPENRRKLAEIPVAELLEISRRAAQLFLEEELPLGEDRQSPDDYVGQLAATTGLPEVMVRRNMAKSHYVMAEMETVLGGLTRGLDLRILDSGWGEQGGRCISYRRESDVLAAILPSNSPGVHSLWIPSIALKTPLVLKPGRQEPWTPYRIAQAYIAAGCPPEAFGFYPTDYAGSGEILARSGRSLLYGDQNTVAPWRSDDRVQIHGPGWSKVVLGPDQAARWEEHVDLMAASVADNGGRSCINASGVWTTDHGLELARGLAQRLAKIEARGLADPEAGLAAFPSREAADRLSTYIDARLDGGGAIDVTAEFRPEGRVAEADGCAFLLPTVIYCESPDHPLAGAEFLFPFVSVVQAPEEELVEGIGSTLVLTALTESPSLRRELMVAPHVERLNVGPLPTSHVSWDQPHEGNLFHHLYQQRAFQEAVFAPLGASGGASGEAAEAS